MNLHNQPRRHYASVCGLLDEDRDTQVQHVLRMLQDSWAQLANDLELLESVHQPTQQ
jgi:hypothetical protein